jgi:AcrR family transcriptional regulator
MARYKEKERKQIKSDTRQALLKAAAEEMAREGYENANINRISTSAGFAKGTVYNYFPSKHALLLALIKEIASHHFEFVQQHVEQQTSPAARLALFFESGFSYVTTYPANSRVVLNAIYSSDVEARETAYRAYQPMFRLISEDILAAGMAQGLFRSVDSVNTTNLLMNIYLGTASQVNDAGVPWLDPEQVADFVYQALVADDG